jgi:hypothetical protein
MNLLKKIHEAAIGSKQVNFMDQLYILALILITKNIEKKFNKF